MSNHYSPFSHPPHLALGRISPEDAGLWTDTQIPPLQRIVHFAHTQGTQIGVQLGHAGRKASTLAPWVIGDMARTRSAGRHVALEDENGWPNNGANGFV
jgi:2,4-dienoyl-CoA reductase-like NADH-dependent reductase (Old Yellow Enzyme family)